MALKLLKKGNSRIERQLYLKILIFFLVVFSITVVAQLYETKTAYQYASVIISFSIFLALILFTYFVVRRNPKFVLSPIPIFGGFSALTLGFGPLFIFLAPSEVVERVYHARWLMLPNDIFSVMQINLVGLMSIFVGLLIAQRLTMVSWRRLSSSTRVDVFSYSKKSLYRGTLILLSISFLLKSSYWIFGIDVMSYLPGALIPLKKIGLAGALTAGMLVGRQVKGLAISHLLLLAIIGLEIIEALLNLDRFDFLAPILVGGIGIFIQKGNIRILVFTAVIVATISVPLRSIVDAGRAEVWVRKTSSSLEFWKSYSGGSINTSDVERSSERLTWWSRWDYTPIQLALMRRYDDGLAGNSFKNIPWLFLPRAIFPSKPVLDHGAQVTKIVMGHDKGSTGTTIFGEAYWNGGFLGVIFSGLFYGCILWCVTVTCMWLFSLNSIYATLLAMFGIFLGVAVRNSFTSIVGGTVIFYCLAFLMRFYTDVIRVSDFRRRLSFSRTLN